MAQRRRIGIIGAGIGGLTAAAALVQADFEVTVFEKASSLGEVGAGLQIGPNAMRVIDALGLRQAFQDSAAEPTERVSLQWDTGALRVREPMMQRMVELYGDRYFMAHRADLHSLLLSRVPAQSIQTGAECADVRQTRNEALVQLSDGRELAFDAVIGADGIHSKVQSALFGQSNARFTGQICWRLIVPMAAFEANRDQLPVDLNGMEYTGWLGPTGHVLFYPLRRGKLLNIFAGRVSSDWAQESWAVHSDIDEMMRAYEGWHPAMLDIMATATEASKWGIHDRDPLPRWTDGRIALLGDAVHPMMPTLAQGAAISMEDGYALARYFAGSPDDLPTALKAFEEERRPRAARVQMQAREQFVNNQKVPAPPPLPVDWIYSHDAVAGVAAARE